MTAVYVEQEGSRCTLRAQGHATGSTEMCAAISSILYALSGYLTNAVRERYIEFYECRMDSGDVLLDFNGDEGTTAAFEMAVIGLLQLEQIGPGLIRVEGPEITKKV